jgi:FkbM family methyltransferase
MRIAWIPYHAFIYILTALFGVKFTDHLVARLDIGNTGSWLEWLMRLLHVPRYQELSCLLEFQLHGWFEKPVVRALHGMYGDTFVDVGAYNGFYCHLLRNNFKHLIAFEPHPTNFDILTRLCRFPNIRLLKLAVSKHSGSQALQLHSSSRHSLKEAPEQFSIDLYPTFKASHSIPVECVRLADFLKLPVDLIKVDTEGNELDILLDWNPTLSRVWLLEMHESREMERAKQYFSNWGYSVQRISEIHLLAKAA